MYIFVFAIKIFLTLHLKQPSYKTCIVVYNKRAMSFEDLLHTINTTCSSQTKSVVEPFVKLFFVPWCDTCNKRVTEFLKLPKQIHGTVIATVNCFQIPEAAIEYGVTEYPTVLLQSSTGKRYTYTGQVSDIPEYIQLISQNK